MKIEEEEQNEKKIIIMAHMFGLGGSTLFSLEKA